MSVPTTRELQRPPRMLGLYARAAAGMLPLAGRRGGGEVPELELALRDVAVDRAHLARYARVCGFRVGDELPATYPHVLAFPLHMALMTDPSFPFAPVGTVHLANRITLKRPLDAGERLDLLVRAREGEPHPKGRLVEMVTEAHAGGEVAWEGLSTFLRRGGGSGETAKKRRKPPEPPRGAVWRLPGDTGRRYADVSGDRNPIHLHDLTAKAFGFKRAIAHGMWTKARCLAALEGRLPDAYTVEVSFEKPILLPARVAFGSLRASAKKIDFAVRDERTGAPHLTGTIR